MTDLQFPLYIDLLKRSDPWPYDHIPNSREVAVAIADHEARRRKYEDWMDALYRLNKVESHASRQSGCR